MEKTSRILRVSNPPNDPKPLSVIAGCLLALQLSGAAAQEADDAEMRAPDISKWQCEYCAFEEGWYTDLTLGIGNVSDDSYKFGEYNGLQEQGSFAIVDGSARYRGDEAAYIDISMSDLGLDSRSLLIEGGRQGSYDLYLSYDEIPHYISDSASTPYLGSGGASLSLPAGWVAAGGTGAMTALDASLRDVDLETSRKRVGAGLSITTESPWSYSLDLRRDDKEGSKRGGGAIAFNTAQLVEPVDYVTEEIDASVSYTRHGLQAKLAYYVSTFSNANESLRWENAYTPPPAAPGAVEGQLALPPDNEFQQLTLSAAYAINDRNQLSADLSVGHMKQDEKLLQTTLNPALLVPLPADSADAEVDTTNTRLKFISRPTDRFRFSLAYQYDDRDNQTPQLLYDWVTTDAFVGGQRANLPYSFTRTLVKLEADYDYGAGTRVGLGYDTDKHERTFLEAEKTDEDTLWGTVRLHNFGNLFLDLKLAMSERDVSSYDLVSAVDPPQNALMRKYNMADRDRNSFSVFANYMPDANYSLGVSLDYARDDYDNSPVGLAESTDSSINFDLTSMLSEETTLTVYVGRQNIRSTQNGSEAFSTPDWSAQNHDSFELAGFGLTHVLIENELTIGLDLSVSKSVGRVELDTGAPFPDLGTSLRSLKLHADYRLDENLLLQAAYWHETYDVDNWALDGLDPDTVNNLLAFGEDNASYENDVIKLAVSFHF
ncbi:MAG: MtrB/PioB family decaheme-associated outer membrane protein [Gammaproteobacteria bacterium]